VHGDGDDVQELIHRLSPDVLFLDFDRTICSTKTGGSPLQGKHSVDEGLLSCILNAAPGSCHIVTRNQHTEDIRKFLASKGIPAGTVGIHSVKAVKSKGPDGKMVTTGGKVAVICHTDLLPPGKVGLFVDDDIAELVQPEIGDKEGLYRVLFAR
jgi:hypothetical protein